MGAFLAGAYTARTKTAHSDTGRVSIGSPTTDVGTTTTSFTYAYATLNPVAAQFIVAPVGTSVGKYAAGTAELTLGQ